MAKPHKPRSQTIGYMPTSDPEGRELKIAVNYDNGEVNYFTGDRPRRGFYLSVTPVKRTEHFESFSAFSGTKMLVEEAERFSQKKLDALAANPSVFREIQDRLIGHVLTKMGAALTSNKPPSLAPRVNPNREPSVPVTPTVPTTPVMPTAIAAPQSKETKAEEEFETSSL